MDELVARAHTARADVETGRRSVGSSYDRYMDKLAREIMKAAKAMKKIDPRYRETAEMYEGQAASIARSMDAVRGNE